MDERDECSREDGRGSASDPAAPAPRRLAREEKTITAMIALYCRDHHDVAAPDDPESDSMRPAADLCAECAELLDYARLRLEKCRYGAAKPTCAKCTTHCYRPEMRERVRAIMRYGGPRMLKRHPLLAIAHLVDGRATPGADR
jgi:hypothetical protein